MSKYPASLQLSLNVYSPALNIIIRINLLPVCLPLFPSTIIEKLKCEDKNKIIILFILKTRSIEKQAEESIDIKNIINDYG